MLRSKEEIHVHQYRSCNQRGSHVFSFQPLIPSPYVPSISLPSIIQAKTETPSSIVYHQISAYPYQNSKSQYPQITLSEIPSCAQYYTPASALNQEPVNSAPHVLSHSTSHFTDHLTDHNIDHCTVSVVPPSNFKHSEYMH